jgi:hypothetical protein
MVVDPAAVYWLVWYVEPLAPREPVNKDMTTVPCVTPVPDNAIPNVNDPVRPVVNVRIPVVTAMEPVNVHAVAIAVVVTKSVSVRFARVNPGLNRLATASSIVPALFIASTAKRDCSAFLVPSVAVDGTTRLAGVPVTLVIVPLVSVAERKSRVSEDALTVRAFAATDAEIDVKAVGVTTDPSAFVVNAIVPLAEGAVSTLVVVGGTFVSTSKRSLLVASEDPVIKRASFVVRLSAVSPLGSILLKEGTPPPLVISTLLLAVASPPTTSGAEEYRSWLTVVVAG